MCTPKTYHVCLECRSCFAHLQETHATKGLCRSPQGHARAQKRYAHTCPQGVACMPLQRALHTRARACACAPARGAMRTCKGTRTLQKHCTHALQGVLHAARTPECSALCVLRFVHAPLYAPRSALYSTLRSRSTYESSYFPRSMKTPLCKEERAGDKK